MADAANKLASEEEDWPGLESAVLADRIDGATSRKSRCYTLSRQ